MNSRGEIASTRISVIESAQDISRSDLQANGLLILSSSGDTFHISWSKYNESSSELCNAVMQVPHQLPLNWDPPCQSFSAKCSDLESARLSSDPPSMAFAHSAFPGCVKTFLFSRIASWSSFLEQLILNGIAVVGSLAPPSLEFYRRCHRGLILYYPPSIELHLSTISNFEELWPSLLNLSENLIKYLHANNSLPKDPAFPLGSAVRVLNERALKQIEGMSSDSHYVPLRLMDDMGEIIDKANLKANIYSHGVLPDELTALLPYIFGLYDPNMSRDAIHLKEQELVREFDLIQKQVRLMKTAQVDRNPRIEGAFRVILHDVHRTDRRSPAFRNPEGKGLEMLTDLLKVYAVFNPAVGYLQGMNDLFVPILLQFLPRWNSDGNPVDADQNVLNSNEYLPKIFWCFEAMLCNINHFDILNNVNTTCRQIAAEAVQIIDASSPLILIWLKHFKLDSLLWLYSDFVLLFKRTFEDAGKIWRIWCLLNCSPNPAKWVAYIIAAAILLTFDGFSKMPEISVNALMERFGEDMRGIDLERLGRLAQYLYERHPTDPPKREVGDAQFGNFQFFTPYWLEN
jgi:hypothetical protein